MEKKNRIKLNDNELDMVSGGASDGAVYYNVVRGDTLSAISKRNGTTVENLMALNPQISNPNLIQVGDTLRIR